MTVHFIGAGPGAPDLITLRGAKLIAQCPVCLYAGSLVPEAVLDHCPKGATIINTAPMSLPELATQFQKASDEGMDVARLHSGDLSIWSAIGEQIAVLKERDIPFTLTPGVPAFSAAAAAMGRELTRPGVAQSVILTRTTGRATSMPPTETLEAFAKTRATLAVHLSIHTLDTVVQRLSPIVGDNCPVAIVYKASWPDERIIRATLKTVCKALADASSNDGPIERTAIILIGDALGDGDIKNSALYDANYQRRYRGRPA